MLESLEFLLETNIYVYNKIDNLNLLRDGALT